MFAIFCYLTKTKLFQIENVLISYSLIVIPIILALPELSMDFEDRLLY